MLWDAILFEYKTLHNSVDFFIWPGSSNWGGPLGNNVWCQRRMSVIFMIFHPMCYKNDVKRREAPWTHIHNTYNSYIRDSKLEWVKKLRVYQPHLRWVANPSHPSHPCLKRSTSLEPLRILPLAYSMWFGVIVSVSLHDFISTEIWIHTMTSKNSKQLTKHN